MKKKNFIFSATFCALAFGCMSMLATWNAQKSNLTELEMANVLALSQEENPPMQNCTRIKSSVGCYKIKKNGEIGDWVCMSITEVEDYQIPVGSPLQCDNVTTTECPDGTTAML
ncbi:MAG: hypothetical protein E7070_10555 [Bacteroidales bacterium]|nr:hypothetical protein [Bacteroidales bacterium]